MQEREEPPLSQKPLPPSKASRDKTGSRGSGGGSGSGSAVRKIRQAASAARKIQKAYRRFRRQFPGGGRLHSRSSPSPTIYQDDDRLSADLCRLFQRELVRLARMTPEARDDEVRAALAAGRVRISPGMVRASLSAGTGRVAFSGGRAARWAVRGHGEARDALPAVSDLTGAQLNYAVLRVQLRDAPRLAAAAVGAPRARLLRTQASRKSVSPRHGGAVREAVLWAEPAPEVIVGAPGDPFVVPRDLRRFMARALGSFSRYRWRMNPRRRRRVAMPAGFRAKRWIMHSNLGVSAKTLYAWLREMYGWREEVAARRNWRALYPRPLLLSGPRATSLDATMRDLLRRHLFGLGGAGGPAAAAAAAAASPRTASPPGSPYARALRKARAEARRAGGGGSAADSTVGSFLGLSRTRPRRPAASNLRVAGLFGDERHAGAFVLFARRSSRGWVLQAALLDPLGAVTFPLALQAAVERALRAAVTALGLGPGGANAAAIGGPVTDTQAAFLPVPRKLAVQYASEGSCGPSALALLLSLLRVARSLPTGASPADAATAAFRGVRDEDVVMAAQLHHNGVL